MENIHALSHYQPKSVDRKFMLPAVVKLFQGLQEEIEFTGVGQNNWNTTIFSTLFKNSVSHKILIQMSLFWYIFPVNRLFLLLNCVFSIIFQI